MKEFEEYQLNLYIKYNLKIADYSGTSLKRTLTGQKFLSTLERSPPGRGLN